MNGQRGQARGYNLPSGHEGQKAHPFQRPIIQLMGQAAGRRGAACGTGGAGKTSGAPETSGAPTGAEDDGAGRAGKGSLQSQDGGRYLGPPELRPVSPPRPRGPQGQYLSPRQWDPNAPRDRSHRPVHIKDSLHMSRSIHSPRRGRDGAGEGQASPPLLREGLGFVSPRTTSPSIPFHSTAFQPHRMPEVSIEDLMNSGGAGRSGRPHAEVTRATQPRPSTVHALACPPKAPRLGTEASMRDDMELVFFATRIDPRPQARREAPGVAGARQLHTSGSYRKGAAREEQRGREEERVPDTHEISLGDLRAWGEGDWEEVGKEPSTADLAMAASSAREVEALRAKASFQDTHPLPRGDSFSFAFAL